MTDVDQLGIINVDGVDLPRTCSIILVQRLNPSAAFPRVIVPINASWLKWRSMTCVLCDKEIPDLPKSIAYRTITCRSLSTAPSVGLRPRK